ncbi:MAG: ribonuclease III domain-containing protein [Gammaproteobacteria bacterium]
MREAIVRALQKLKGYQQALTHISHSQDCNNERFEFLGDAVIEVIVSEEIYRRLPELDEGKMSLARSSLVNGNNLADIFLSLGISKEVLLSRGTGNLPEERKLSIYAGVLEALIGAYYLEYGFEKSTKLINELFKFEELDWHSLTEKDVKTKLQEYLQQTGLDFPQLHYEYDANTGFHQVWTMFKEQKFKSSSKLKKMAEQDLCSQILEAANG